MRPEDLDDGAPPNADNATHAEVRSRGRRLRRRQRAIRGAGVGFVAVALFAGVVAIVRSDDNRPAVSVEPTNTTTPGAPMAYERYGEAAGVRYAFLLHTPVVAPGATVNVELLVENRTSRVVHIDACADSLSVTVFTPRGNRLRITTTPCQGGGTTLAAGGVMEDNGETPAPREPGRYLVAITSPEHLPAPLLEPLDLQVVAPPTGSPPSCSSETSVSAHPELPAPAGILSIPGLTKISSDAGGLSPFKGIAHTPPTSNCTYTAVGGVGQFWVLSAAIEQYGSAAKVPLPIPLTLASKHPGPAEVNVAVLVFRDRASPQALLNNPTYNTNPSWTRLPDVSIPDGFVIKTYSVANDGLSGFIVQRAIGHTWIEVGVVGANLTAEEAVHTAESVAVSP
ncbi:MAG: hypothetical protein M3Q30_21620 [Actinomycetota bacterium]|nr:hypothetical protein [Actinomycetota bacterium]